MRNLRSSVCRQALDCYAQLFERLRRAMDGEVDVVCRVLVPKTGDTSNAFIRDDALRALEALVDHVTPRRSLWAIAATGVE